MLLEIKKCISGGFGRGKGDILLSVYIGDGFSYACQTIGVRNSGWIPLFEEEGKEIGGNPVVCLYERRLF